MKTNVPIILTDAERNQLKILIDGRVSKKMVSRSEVVAICQQHIGGLIGQINNNGENQVISKPIDASPASALYDIAPEDAAILQGKSLGYIRGWNTVKRGKKS